MGNWSFVCVFLWFLLREFGLIVVNCLCSVRYKMIIFVYNLLYIFKDGENDCELIKLFKCFI